MTAELLLAEARQVARPCVYVSELPADGPLVGIWRGRGLVPLSEPKHRHWLSIDCGQLPADLADLGLTGVMSVYKNEKDYRTGRCVLDRERVSLNGGDGSYLVGRPGMSLPTVTQLLRHPTPRVQEWMAEVGCAVSGTKWTSSEECGKVCRAYTERVAAEDPAREPENTIAAVLGGWPVEIYEDDWATKVADPAARQLVFTYADAEPWVQVWVDGAGAFHVRQIIT